MESRVYPAKLGFPPATQDVGQLVGDERVVRLSADALRFDEIVAHPSLRSLWCVGIDRQKLATIARCSQLEALYLENVRVPDLEPLVCLGRLQVLSLDGATKVETLDWLPRMRPLSQLGLGGLVRVSSFVPVSAQAKLEALSVSGSMWTRVKVDSLEWLSGLRELRLLDLVNTVSLDGSLAVLADLPSLEELTTAAFYKWDEFARLSGLRPDLRCNWFEPYSMFEHETCASCSSPLVMLTGKGQPTICPKCQSARVEKHTERFRRVAREAAQQTDED